MKEDILEQLAEDYLQTLGYFTVANVKFKPSKEEPEYDPKQDSVYSDIDVLGYNPLLKGTDRVLTVSCKSFQEGFWPEWYIKALEEEKIVGGRVAWKSFRELWVPKWAKAFRNEVKRRTGESRFTYITAVTRLQSSREPWEQYQRFGAVLGCPVRILTLEEMATVVLQALSETVASSALGRTLQLLKAAGMV